MEDLTITNLVFSLFTLQPKLILTFSMCDLSSDMYLCKCALLYNGSNGTVQNVKCLSKSFSNTHTHTHTHTHKFIYYTCALNYAYKSTGGKYHCTHFH